MDTKRVSLFNELIKEVLCSPLESAAHGLVQTYPELVSREEWINDNTKSNTLEWPRGRYSYFYPI